ncbi:MAG: ATP synthase subunit I [Epulopiscium sp.]|nr:ATP synthase subunit I [Candidatus Epulonipiscium sp.]
MKRLILQILGIGIIVGVIGLFFVDEPLPWIKGLAFGIIFSILRLRLMDISVKRSVRMAPQKARNYAIAQYMIRYVLTAIILMIAVLEPSISFLGVVSGLLTLKASTYLMIIGEKKKN